MYSYEKKYRAQGFQCIAGIDEAGRGPLAGPVVAAAVILPACAISGINDSKKLTAVQRERIFRELLLHAHIGVGIVHHTIIDASDILKATKLAMKYAVEDLCAHADFLLIDGSPITIDSKLPQLCIVKGDSLSASIAAASIVAKVTRDRMMVRYHTTYPEYHFDRHKGYPTAEHLKLLRKYGPSPIHRKTFAPVHACIHVHS